MLSYMYTDGEMSNDEQFPLCPVHCLGCSTPFLALCAPAWSHNVAYAMPKVRCSEDVVENASHARAGTSNIHSANSLNV